MWTSGQCLDLLREIKEEVRQRHRRHAKKPSDDDNDSGLPRSARRAVLRALQESALSKASKILLSCDCGVLGPEADPARQELHPAATPPLSPRYPRRTLRS